MKTPSRMMKPLRTDQKMGAAGWPLAIFFTVVAVLAIYSAELRIVVGLIVVAIVILGIVSHIHAKRLERERGGDSICTFAKTLPAREHDTWILRAIYEGLSNDRGHGIRPADRLEEDLLFHPEDIDDIVVGIAMRARRSVAQADQNPLANKVVTVLDLINFLEQQPKIARA